jgi:hypothetical protein
MGGISNIFLADGDETSNVMEYIGRARAALEQLD